MIYYIWYDNICVACFVPVLPWILDRTPFANSDIFRGRHQFPFFAFYNHLNKKIARFLSFGISKLEPVIIFVMGFVSKPSSSRQRCNRHLIEFFFWFAAIFFPKFIRSRTPQMGGFPNPKQLFHYLRWIIRHISYKVPEKKNEYKLKNHPWK